MDILVTRGIGDIAMAFGWKLLIRVYANSYDTTEPPWDRTNKTLGGSPGILRIITPDPEVKRVMRYYSHACRTGVYYDIGRWTLPNPRWGPLAIYDTYENSRVYSKYNIVFPCEYLPSTRKEFLYDRIVYHIDDLPQGTVLADAVRIF